MSPVPPAELFTRCGQFLCGQGPKWKEQFAAMLMVQTNTIDNMSKGTSRIPPGMWREIADFIADRERHTDTLRSAALALAEEALARNQRGDGMQQVVTSEPRPAFICERISPAIVGAMFTERSIARINRQFKEAPPGHPFREFELLASHNGGAVLKMQSTTSRENIEATKAWIENEMRSLGFAIDPSRTTNTSSGQS